VLILCTVDYEKIKISVDFEKNKEIRVNQNSMYLKPLACLLCDFMICTLIYCIKMIENSDKSDANNVIS
jgi:hypothetical protein